MPFMLPVEDSELMTAWLDPELNETDRFLPYMQPVLRTDYEVTPLKKWRSFDASGDSFIIEADR